MSNAASLKADANECIRLAQLTDRDSIRQLLFNESQKFLNLAATEEKKSGSGTSVTRQSNIVSVKIVNYAWDQSDKYVKLYVTLNGVGALSQNSIVSSFQNREVELSISELDNKNYSLVIKNLLHAIKPDESYHKVKTDMVVLFLKKEKSDQWDCITESEKKTKERKTPKYDKDEDPSASLINLMKQMYDDGDDEMKRTIAKAWTEAREKPSPM